MVIIKIKENSEKILKEKIRRYFDVKGQKWYFSIVDAIAALTDSTDARNYWKVLKNRLKKSNFELVTKCNQLKMKAKDGKYYLTDTADAETMMEIIESIPRATVGAFKILINDMEEIAPKLREEALEGVVETPILSSASTILARTVLARLPEVESEAKLLVDAYETESSIFIKAMIAGVSPDLLSISVGSKKIVIEGKRYPEFKKNENDFSILELDWVSFSRTVDLPTKVQKDNVRTTEQNGLLVIELVKEI